MRSVGRWLPAVARTTGTVVLTIVIVFAVFRATAPFLISSGLVRSGIEDVHRHGEQADSPPRSYAPDVRRTCLAC